VFFSPCIILIITYIKDPPINTGLLFA